MKAFDLWLQRWRIDKTRPHIEAGARLLDIGCADGALFRQLDPLIGEAVGIDEHAEETAAPGADARFTFVKGRFPTGLESEPPFDVITLLAVLEHIPPEEHGPFAEACARLVRHGGHLLITTPSPLVDPILDFLAAVRVIDGMELHQHYGFKPKDTPPIFEKTGFELVRWDKFQLGLNNLFVFRRTAEAYL